MTAQPQIEPVTDEDVMVARLTAANGWRPIETAPKCDCCPPVDAWVKSCLLGRFDGHGWIAWVGQMDSGMWLEGNSRRSFGDSEMPTHWMPLPAPPKENTNG